MTRLTIGPNHHALPAPIPRRARAGFRSRKSWAAREAQEGRARVEGALAVQPGEDAVVLRQRPEGLLFDFSSGKNGDIFDFVMETEGVSFPEAVERLAGMAGLPMPVVSREAEAREERRKHAARRDRARREILRGDACVARRRACARLSRRPRDRARRRSCKFRLGYAPAERFALKEHLGAQGVSVEDMVEAGLLIAGDDIPVPYDRFRDRVMFPITDLRGRVIAFGGRALQKDAPAKYLNSPETPLFHKGASSTTARPRARPRTRARAWSRSRATST